MSPPCRTTPTRSPRVNWCANGGPRLAQSIRGMGFEVFPSAGNFVLVRFPDETKSARDADAFLHSRGLIVRPVGGYGLTDCLRITVGTPAQNGVLLDALQAFAES